AARPATNWMRAGAGTTFATYRSPPARTVQVEDLPSGSHESTARCQPVRSAARTCSAVATAPIMAHPGAAPRRNAATRIDTVQGRWDPPGPTDPASPDVPGAAPHDRPPTR